jgi:hypothetical protein
VSKKTKTERKKERARRDAEKREAKRLIEQPHAGDEKNRGDQEQNAVPAAATENLIRKQPCEKSDQETGAAKEQTQKRGNAVRFFTSKRDAIVAFLDRHGGSVSAVATAVSALGTIAIVVLTCFYVHYSRSQWETMQQQMRDVEIAEAGRLKFDFSPTVVCCSGDFARIDNGDLTITNVGATELRQLVVLGPSLWGSVAVPEPHNTPPTDFPNGMNLAKDDHITVSMLGDSALISEDAQNGKWFMGIRFAVSYRDVFGNLGGESRCYMYYFRQKKFGLCPASVKGPVYMP